MEGALDSDARPQKALVRRVQVGTHLKLHKGKAKLVITNRAQTRYLFRVNKGKADLGESINQHIPEHLRTIPFFDIIYIDDGTWRSFRSVITSVRVRTSSQRW